MTPDFDWRGEYRDRPVALAKLDYCDRVIAEVRDREPLVASDELDEDVSEIAYSLDDYYASLRVLGEPPPPPGVDGALRAIFDDDRHRPGSSSLLASALIRDHARRIAAEVYRWTGHFPERTLPLLDHLAGRADALDQVYSREHEFEAVVALTAYVTAMSSQESP